MGVHQIDEIWILFLIILAILIVIFAVLRQSHGENYSGTIEDVPIFKPQKAISASYEDIPDSSEPVAAQPSSVAAQHIENPTQLPSVPRPKGSKLYKAPVQSSEAIPAPVAPQTTHVPIVPSVQTPVQQTGYKNKTTFDKDVTDPSIYLFRPQVRLPSKHRLHAGADPFRGDLHITPVNRNGHFQSRWGTDSLRHDTMFNEVFAKKYNQLSEYHVQNEEVLAV